MSAVAIQCDRIGKRYRIGTAPRYRALRDTLSDAMYAPVRGVRRLLSGTSQDRAATSNDTIWALENVSFEIPHGEVIGIIGRNGAGKSTLLKILARITAPTVGEAFLSGRVGSLLEVGTGFHPELTGRENIFLNGAILGMRKSEIARNFDQIVAFSECGEFLDTPVKHYSSGMYMRLAFAVAAHLDPEIMLVDEVLAVGDAIFQKKCLGRMGEVARSGRTVLFVSHNMTAIQSLCTRVLCIERGQVIADGRPSDVIPKYLSTTIAKSQEQVFHVPANAPGDNKARVRRAAVCPAAGHPGDEVTVRTPIHVEIEYWNLDPTAHIDVGLNVYNKYGVLAFATGTIANPPMPRGIVRVSGTVPGDLLNSGMHIFEPYFVENQTQLRFVCHQMLSVDVQDVPDLRGDWFDEWNGVVRPHIPWSTQVLEEDKSLAPLQPERL